MKATISIFKLTAVVFLLSIGTNFSQSSTPCPSASPSASPTPQNNGSNDPAFAFMDPKPAKSLAERIAGIFGATSAKKQNSSNIQSWDAIQARFQKEPKESYAIALQVWQSSVPDDVKRQTILKALSLVRKTEQTENLNFMLDCMEDVAKQRQIYTTMLKGNGLERQIAAHKFALINSNPQFRSSN